MTKTQKPAIHSQGKAVIEEDDGHWLLMLPTGEISAHPTREAAFKAAARWAKRNAKQQPDAINVMITEEH